MKKLKERWQISSNWQLTVIFIVFAITGSTSAWASKLVMPLLGLTKTNLGFFYWPVRIIAVFPLYQVLLVFNGFIFGQFAFFWQFEKKMLTSLGLGFLFKKQEKK